MEEIELENVEEHKIILTKPDIKPYKYSDDHEIDPEENKRFSWKFNFGFDFLKKKISSFKVYFTFKW